MIVIAVRKAFIFTLDKSLVRSIANLEKKFGKFSVDLNLLFKNNLFASIDDGRELTAIASDVMLLTLLQLLHLLASRVTVLENIFFVVSCGTLASNLYIYGHCNESKLADVTVISC